MNTSRQAAPARRQAQPSWTPTRIRKTLLHPKPLGAAAKALQYQHGTAWRGPIGRPGELELLRWIAEHADLLRLPVPHPDGFEPDRRGAWLLVPLSFKMLEALALFEAELADLEVDEDVEHGSEDEPDVDREPSLGASDNVRQLGWAFGGSDVEADEADAEDDGTREPNVNAADRVLSYADRRAERLTVREWRSARVSP